MNKILLIIEDFTELETMESMLKRLGFDVFAIGKEVLVGDALQRFQADLAFVTYKGRQLDGLKIAARLKMARAGVAIPRVVLVWSKSSGVVTPRLSPEQAVLCDALVDGPIEPYAAIHILAQLLAVDQAALIKKYERVTGIPLTQKIVVAGSVPADKGAETGGRSGSATPNARENRYKEFLAANDEPVAATHLSRDLLRAAAATLSASETPEDKALNEQILNEKREFAEKLLRAGKR